MNRKLTLLLMVVAVTNTSAQETASNNSDMNDRKISDVTQQEDSYLWLEDVMGDGALDWVRAQNKTTQAHFESADGFAELRDDLLAILDSDERIPYVTKRGPHFYNFWRDKNHVRGIWRRTSLESYQSDDPKWDVMLDLDELAQQEDKNWVWGGVSLLKPDYNLALVELSRGGADATVTREFDMQSRTFVDGGFFRPEAKGGLEWIDEDSVFVYSDFGQGSLTTSGYPRIVKHWRRGTPLEQAELVFEGKPADIYISASHDDSPGFERSFVRRATTFYSDELLLVQEDGKLTKIDAPDSATKSVFHDHLFIKLRKSWKLASHTYQPGTLLVTDFEEFMEGKREFYVAFEPTPTTSLVKGNGFSATKDHILLNVLEDVTNHVYVLTREGTSWSREALAGGPEFGNVRITPVEADESNDYWMISRGFLTPPTLHLGTIGKEPRQLKQQTSMYDASNLAVKQHFATSQDGTRIPYFVVASQDLELKGENPTLLYGYGGFEISLLPEYSAGVGRAWTSQGGVYVVANIRGGGEYGPQWHQAALKQNRLRAYEDFAAVGQDLISRKITRRERLGIQGGSNGGLLVGNMVTRYPKLCQAAVCQVPLLDMRRYHLLLAGASWIAEYGDPDKAGEWEFIQTFSPYQNVRQEVEYPAVLFTTSTRDDRVHPGHARKMMALMKEQGHDVSYYENIEGGHSGAANNKQRAYMQALAYSFLKQRLFPQD